MTELTELELLEVSLVDAGDDPLAKVAIFKQKEENMTDEELDKQKQEENKRPAYKALYEETRKEVDALADANEALVAKNEVLEQKIEELEKAAKELEGIVEKHKPAEEMIEFDGEQIAKSAIPAPILKKLEEDRVKLEELNKAREKEALEKRTQDILPNTVGTLEKKAKLVKAFGDDEEMLEMLRAIDAAFASHFEEVGKGKAVEFESPQDELDSMIKAYMDEHNVEKAKATVEVTKSGAGRELLLKTQKKETK